MSLRSGSQLGPYEILSPLGRGGMGEVYRARDTRLERDVAVKVLPEELSRDAASLTRFHREAKAIAALSHPNILAIYDVGTEGDISYVVTELLEGETLRDRVRETALPWRKAIEMGTVIVNGLAAAHAKGVIHRDLKPENIFITTDGVVKILDFGLARMDQPESTENRADTPTLTMVTERGVVLGTIGYMSPEQVRGLKIDARSDIFSFGCVMHEMLAGTRAFSGDTPADTMTAILKEEPVELVASGSAVPLELRQVVARCLEKKPQERYQSASDLAFTLHTILGRSAAEISPPPTRRAPWELRRIGPVFIVALVFLAGFLYFRNDRVQNAGAATPIESLAVLPFDNLSGDPAQNAFADSMTDALITNLAKISALRLTSPTSAMRYRGTTAPLSEIARQLNDVNAIVTGTILIAEERVRISVRLTEVLTEQVLWSDSYDRDLRDVLTMQMEVARAIAESIRVRLTPAEQALLASAPVVNPAAYTAYVRGLEQVRIGSEQSCRTALKLFERALEIDPDFALAHVGRADAYYMLANRYLPPKQAMPLSKEAALAALELDENLAEAYAALGHYQMEYEWNWEAARESYEHALKLNSSLTEARLGYASYLTVMKRPDEAMAQLDIVQEHDPASRYSFEDHGAVSFMCRRYKRTIHDGREALKMDPDYWAAHQWMGLAFAQQGRFTEAIRHLRKSNSMHDSPAGWAMLGSVLASDGQTEEAKSILKTLKEQEDRRYVCPYELATISINLGDFDEAFDEMHRACDARANCIPWLQGDPRVDLIREDPRFDRVLERAGFVPPARLREVEPKDSPKAKLLILPFEGTSSDADTNYLKVEIPASIIHSLSALSGLQVIPRSTAFRYRVGDRDTASIGRDLGVTVVLTGQISVRGDALSIRVELVDVAMNRQLWDERYNRKLADLLAIEEDIATQISEALRLRLTSQDRTRLNKRDTDNAAAHRAYLEGRFWWNKRTEKGFERAIALYDEAILIDPDYALAYAGKAECYCLAGWYFRAPGEVMGQAREAIETALALDPLLPEAYATRALVRADYEWNWAGAERDFQRAIELNPRYATAHHWYALVLGARGRFDEAQRQIMRARELDPGSLIINRDIGANYFIRRQFDRAIEQYRSTLMMDPTFVQARVTLASALLADGRFDEAITEIQQVYHEAGRFPRAAGILGQIYAAAGRTEDAHRELQTLTALATRQYVPPVAFALIHGELGEFDTAFDRMEEAIEERDGSLSFLAVSPWFDALRDDPRFDDLLRRVGLSLH